MARMDVGKAFNPSFEHMVRVLFRPFMLSKWLALGFVSMIAYGGGSSFNVPNFGGPSDRGGPFPGGNPIEWMIHYWMLLALGFVFLVALGILLTWLSSVMQFVYVDEIVRSSAAIREPWARLKGLGFSYFLWRLVFGFAVLLFLVILVGVPLAIVFIPSFKVTAAGPKIAAAVWAALIFIFTIIVTGIIDLFARDFVVPAMYARRLGVLKGWRTIIPILRENAGQLVIYILLLIVVAIGIAIYSMLVLLVALLVFAIPVGVLVGIGYVIFKAMGLSWNIPLIVVAATIGTVVLAALIYTVQVGLQPAQVFRRAFSLAVLGQADPSLATLPSEAPSPPAPGPA